MDDPDQDRVSATSSGTTWPLLIAFLAGYVGSVENQSPGARSSATLFAGADADVIVCGHCQDIPQNCDMN